VVLTADLVFHDQKKKEKKKMRVAADTRGDFCFFCVFSCVRWTGGCIDRGELSLFRCFFFHAAVFGCCEV
jgi:hypothetical protein